MARHQGNETSTNRDYEGRHRLTSTTDKDGVRTDRNGDGRVIGWSAGRGADGTLNEDGYTR